MIKKIIPLFIFALMASCNIQYDGETRLVVEGNLKDRDGNPLAGRAAYVRLSNGFDNDIISSTNSDGSGHFLMIFPSSDSENDAIAIYLGGDATHQSKYLSNLHKSNFNNYKYKVDEILYNPEDIAQLIVNLNRTNSNKHVKNIRVEGLQTFSEFDFDKIYADDQPQSFFVIKNQELVLHYTIYDDITQLSTDYSENITIGNDNINFNITY